MIRYTDFSEADRTKAADRISEIKDERGLDLLECCMALQDEAALGAFVGEDARLFRIFMLGMREMMVGPL